MRRVMAWTRTGRRLAWAAVAGLAAWPGVPLAALGWSLAAARGPLEALASERAAAQGAAVHQLTDPSGAPPAAYRRVSRELTQLAARLDSARTAVGWLGDERAWPVVGPADQALRNAVGGAAAVATAANEVWRALAVPGAAARRAAALHAAWMALPGLARGTSELEAAAARLPVPARWVAALRQVAPAVRQVAEARPALAAAAGLHTPARYLVLVQDAAELRATGGLLVAYGWLTVTNGRARFAYGGGIRQLSARATAHLPAGPILAHFFHEARLSLLNANDQLGGPASAAAILRLYQSVPHAPPVQGLLLANSWWIDGLFGAAGPVVVHAPAGPVVLTAASAPRQLEVLAERNRTPGVPRMAFLGPVVATLMARLMPHGDPQPALWGAVAQGLGSAGLLWEPQDPALKALAGRWGWSGALLPSPPQDNYLLVVNQNMGGLKDNLYLTQTVHVAITGRREQITVGLALPHRVTAANAWLLGSYEGYLSVVVPAGTRVAHSAGFVSAVTATTGGRPRRTVVGGAVTVPVAAQAASSQSTVALSLVLPNSVAPGAPLLVQAQPGWRPGADQIVAHLDGQTRRWDAMSAAWVCPSRRGLVFGAVAAP